VSTGKISNLALYLVGDVTAAVAVTVALTPPATLMAVSVVNGVERSNAGVFDGGNQPRPLNAAVGATFAQVVTVSVDKAGMETNLQRMRDIGLWVEFEMAV